MVKSDEPSDCEVVMLANDPNNARTMLDVEQLRLVEHSKTVQDSWLDCGAVTKVERRDYKFHVDINKAIDAAEVELVDQQRYLVMDMKNRLLSSNFLLGFLSW